MTAVTQSTNWQLTWTPPLRTRCAALSSPLTSSPPHVLTPQFLTPHTPSPHPVVPGSLEVVVASDAVYNDNYGRLLEILRYFAACAWRYHARRYYVCDPIPLR